MRGSVRGAIVATGERALRIDPVATAAGRYAAGRGRRLVLVFHRIVPGAAIPGGVVTQVSLATFREQLAVLRDVGEVVPLRSLLEPSPGRRPRFALTFDDDWATHHDVVLPTLVELGLSGTFFLCGRGLHGLGPLWFDVLDALLLEHGPDHVARLLDTRVAPPAALGERCQADRRLQRRLVEMGADVARRLDRAAIGALAHAGMTIGFHTLDHEVMTALPAQALDATVRDGRRELEEETDSRVTLFAYPHGIADAATASYVQRAGYEAAWTGKQRPFVPGDDPFLLGRWEPGPLRGGDFRARVAATLNGWTGTIGRAR